MTFVRRIQTFRDTLRTKGLSQLRLGFLLVGVLATIPLLLTLAYFANEQRAQAMAEAREHLNILTVALASDADAIGAPSAGPLKARLAAHTGFVAVHLDPRDRVVAIYPRTMADSFSQQADLYGAMASLEPFERSVAGVEYLFAGSPVPSGGTVFVGLPTKPIIASVEREIRRQAATVLAAFMMSVLIGLIGSEILIFRPLGSLSATTNALQSGDLSARTSVSGAGEVKVLATGINSLAASIEDRQMRLETARRLAEAAWRQADAANEAKSEFLASMSHEIRTPLHSIMGYADLLIEGPLAPKQKRYAEQVQSAAGAALTIVNDVLDLSTIEAGRLTIAPRPFLLCALVENAISIVNGFADRKGIKLTAHVDPTLPAVVFGDDARIRQVLLNLLNNAVKFTSAGAITLEVVRAAEGSSAGGDRIRFSVSDTGIGIPAHEQDQLFKRFTQIGPRTVHGGTGLGLAISKRLVEEMGGTIGFHSEVQRGSTFWVDLLLPESELETGPAMEGASEADGHLHILVADDLQMNVEIAKAMLEGAGHEVDTAHSGRQAVSLCGRHRYDVILMDIQMQDLDGLSAAQMIREKGPSRTARIIAMTANVLPQQVHKYREAGIDDHLGKPYPRAELLRKVNAVAREAVGQTHASEAEPPDFDRLTFTELEALLGHDQLSAWLRRLTDEVAQLRDMASGNAFERADLARLCHSLVSHAGSMGFVRLAQACRTLEDACLQSGADISGQMAEASANAEAALARLEQLTDTSADA